MAADLASSAASRRSPIRTLSPSSTGKSLQSFVGESVAGRRRSPGQSPGVARSQAGASQGPMNLQELIEAARRDRPTGRGSTSRTVAGRSPASSRKRKGAPLGTVGSGSSTPTKRALRDIFRSPRASPSQSPSKGYQSPLNGTERLHRQRVRASGPVAAVHDRANEGPSLPPSGTLGRSTASRD